MPGAGAGANVGGPQTIGGQDANRKSRKRRAAGDGVVGVEGDEEAKPAGGKNEYECRFCLMKFEKSQALGGHMNRHRQEREKEQVQHAHQILNSVAQQQLPHTWSSLSAEIFESPSGPGSGNGSSDASLLGGATRQQCIAPPICFGTSFRPTSPSTGPQLPPSPRTAPSNCNYYLPSNASSCNVASNIAGNNINMHNQHNQLQQWIESMDRFSNAASNSPRSISICHSPVDNNMAITLQAAATGISSEFLGSMLRNSSIDGNTLQVSPGTPTSSQAPGTYDFIYNSTQLANTFYNGSSM